MCSREARECKELAGLRGMWNLVQQSATEIPRRPPEGLLRVKEDGVLYLLRRYVDTE